MNTPIVLNTPPRVLMNLPHAIAGAKELAPRHSLARVCWREPRTSAIKIKHLLAATLLASVVGCGTTSGDRAVSDRRKISRSVRHAKPRDG